MCVWEPTVVDEYNQINKIQVVKRNILDTKGRAEAPLGTTSME